MEVLNMAWRPTRYLKEGQLENKTLGKVTGWMEFAGMKEKVTFNLEGDFHRDIRGAMIHFRGDAFEEGDVEGAQKYMEDFAQHQTGKVGDITAGLEPRDFSDSPYIEAYTSENGRIVIELEPTQVEVIGTPIPAMESFPISRKQQNRNMAEFLGKMASELNLPAQNVIVVGQAPPKMELLPDSIRKQLPPLYSQDGKCGKAIAYLKLFTPDSGFTFFATEFDGNDMFFGLVEGFEKELGYFSLSELQGIRGPMGLPIERDLHFKPTPLEKIAPELFREANTGGD
jgi:hypothetical protein